MRLQDRVCRDVRDVCVSRPRQGGVLSHPTWRFQFHFLSRRPPLAPNRGAANPPPEATLRHRSGPRNSQPPHALLFASRRSQMQASSIHGCSLDLASFDPPPLRSLKLKMKFTNMVKFTT